MRAHEVRGVAAAAVALAALAAGCTSGSSSPGSPAPSATALPSALVQQAQAASGFTGTAHYALYAPTRPLASAIVLRRGTDLRVDVVQGTTTASLFETSSGVAACTSTTVRRCVSVGAAGTSLPSSLDPGIERVVIDAATVLSSAPAGYVAKPVAGRTEAGIAADCYDLTPPSPAPSASTTTGSSAGAVTAGTYCFGTETPILVAATFSDGSTVTLTSYDAAAPAATAFTPYASPEPLPTTSATPTP